MSRLLRHERLLSHDGLWIDAQHCGDASGDPILICNGLGASLADLEALTAAWTTQHSILSWDARGFHRSEAPRTPAGWNLEAQVGDAEQLLMRSQGSVTIVGWSTGAAHAVSLAARYPSRVARLVLLCPLLPDPGLRPKWLPDLTRMLRRLAERSALWEVGVAWAGQSAIALRVAQQLHWLAPTLSPTDWQSIALRLTGQAPGTLASTLEAWLNAECSDQVREIPCPTLVLGGREDAVATPGMLNALCTLFPNAKHFTLPLGTHSLPLELPDYVGLHCEEFFLHHPIGDASGAATLTR